MKRKSEEKQRDSGFSHYLVPSSLHERRAPRQQQRRARRRAMAMTCLTMTTLIDVMRERAGQPGLPTQASLPNFESALRHFVEERGLKPDDPIGGLLRLGYPKALAAHTTALLKRKADRRVIANRASALKKWRKLVAVLDRESAAMAGAKPPFSAALTRLMEECRTPGGEQISIRAIALQAGVPIATLRRWIDGVHPKGRHVVRYIRRLERFFGLAPGAIFDTLAGERLPDRKDKEMDTPRNEYRARLSRQSRDPYLLKPSESSAAFRAEWTALIQMKTQTFAGSDVWSTVPIEAGVRKMWVLHGPNSARGAADDWVDSRNNRFVSNRRKRLQICRWVHRLVGTSNGTWRGGAGRCRLPVAVLLHGYPAALAVSGVADRARRRGDQRCGHDDTAVRWDAPASANRILAAKPSAWKEDGHYDQSGVGAAL